MKKAASWLLLFLVIAMAANTQPIKKRVTKKINYANINWNNLKLTDIKTTYKDYSFKDRFVLLAKAKGRYKTLPKLKADFKQGTAANGLTYYVSRNNIQLPPNNTG